MVGLDLFVIIRGVSWSNGRLYLAIIANIITEHSNDGNFWVTFWIDTDPQLNPSTGMIRKASSDDGTGTGSTSGPTFRTQTPRFNFTANYLLQWQFNLGTIKIKSYTTAWADKVTDLTSNANGNFVEFSVGMSYISNPGAIYICGCVIDETQNRERAYASFPISFDGNTYYQNIIWNSYYG